MTMVLAMDSVRPSTIVMLRGFMDRGWLNTPDGQVAVGWRVMEDIATVLIIMVLPNLADTGRPVDWRTLGLALLSALGFIVGVMGELGIPHLVIDSHVGRIERLAKQGIPTLLGNTANSDVLTHAALHRARLLVVTLPEEAATELTVAAARDLAPNLPILARAATRAGVKRLSELGAQLVIHPELEGGLQVLRHTLLQLGFPLHEVRRYADTVRREHYDTLVKAHGEHALLRELLDASELIDITWRKVPTDSPLAGKCWVRPPCVPGPAPPWWRSSARTNSW
jgi:voltage-gated potassium channel Kch